jgi:DNA-binding MarR family transcriptional regulator
MNYFEPSTVNVSEHQLQQFQSLMTRLFQCCQERMQYQSERFEIPDAELRCLLLFQDERYLTSKGIAPKMRVVKSRVSKIINSLIKKQLIQKVKDPEDSRINLFSLTPRGQSKLEEINLFLRSIHHETLQQMAPEQRTTMLTNLDLLKASLEAVREFMD